MADTTGKGPASVELDNWLAREKEAGLLELAAYPGQDREIAREDAARVIMAMIRESEGTSPISHEI